MVPGLGRTVVLRGGVASAARAASLGSVDGGGDAGGPAAPLPSSAADAPRAPTLGGSEFRLAHFASGPPPPTRGSPGSAGVGGGGVASAARPPRSARGGFGAARGGAMRWCQGSGGLWSCGEASLRRPGPPRSARWMGVATRGARRPPSRPPPPTPPGPPRSAEVNSASLISPPAPRHPPGDPPVLRGWVGEASLRRRRAASLGLVDRGWRTRGARRPPSRPPPPTPPGPPRSAEVNSASLISPPAPRHPPGDPPVLRGWVGEASLRRRGRLARLGAGSGWRGGAGWCQGSGGLWSCGEASLRRRGRLARLEAGEGRRRRLREAGQEGGARSDESEGCDGAVWQARGKRPQTGLKPTLRTFREARRRQTDASASRSRSLCATAS